MVKCVRRSFMWMLLAACVIAAPAAQAGDQYGYNEGYFVSSADDDFMMRINGTFVANWLGQVNDGAGRADVNGFNVPLARTYLTGHAFGPEWTYNFSIDLAGGVVTAVDAFVNWMHSEMFNLRAGNFKVPHGFEFLIPDPLFQFATRAQVAAAGVPAPGLAAGGFIPGREVGVMAWGSLADKMVDYWVSVTNGLANGTGAMASQPAGDTDFRYTARLTFHVMGHHDFWVSDINRSEETSLALSAGGYWNKIDIDADASFDDTFGAEADLVFASMGWSALVEYHLFNSDGSTIGSATNHGVLGQVGYMLTDAAELAARVSWNEPDAAGRTLAPGAVLNWYLHGHNAKVQLEYDMILRDDFPLAGSDATDHMGVLQIQFAI